MQPEMGGILHLRLNMGGRPIAHKYRKGKMQRTLKREFKELEVVEREAIAVSEGCQHVGWIPQIYIDLEITNKCCTSWHQLSWYENRRVIKVANRRTLTGTAQEGWQPLG